MIANMLLWSLGGPEILVIALLIVLLFGAKKIPELMKGIGKGVKSFKQGMAEAEDELKSTKDEAATGDAPSKEGKA